MDTINLHSTSGVSYSNKQNNVHNFNTKFTATDNPILQKLQTAVI